MRKDTIYDLMWKMDFNHYYFGSLAAIYDTFDAGSDIGVTLKELYMHDFSEPFENENCTIVKSKLIRKKQSHGRS